MKNHNDHAEVRVIPPLLPLLSIVAALLLHWLLPLPLAFPDVLVWIGYLLIVLGLGLSFRAVNQFAKEHTTLDAYGSVSKIVTNGPYRFSRNPIYLGFVCFMIGFTLIFKTYWGLILSPLLILAMYQLVIKHEEAYLEKKFGEAYTSYTSRVRRWL